jgi:UDP-N-acetylmuramate dehydrogenase
MTVEAALVATFGAERVRRGVVLAPYTTFRVGGVADWFLETRDSDEVARALQISHASRMPVTLLGGGSNVLVSDTGIRGLVIRPRGGEVRFVGDDLQREQDRALPGLVRADAAVTINGLVRWSVMHGAAGLEAWAGTPGTVGGAIFGNAHFGGRLIGDQIDRVTLADRGGGVRIVPAAEMAFGYDRSRLQETGEVLLSADFRVSAGDPIRLRATARESLAFRKRTQPLDTPSAGCVFQNPERGRDRVPGGIPWSAGALVDRAGLKGARLGGASVSTTHGNFIVNDGSASAQDIRQLIEQCRQAVHDRFGVELREEIVYLGDFGDVRNVES